MTEYFEFLHAEYNPNGLTGNVGGNITETELIPSVNELFVPIDTSTVGESYYQYRKCWARQIAGHFSTLSVELSNLEQTGRIGYAMESGAIITGDSPTGMPTGLTEGDFFGNVEASINIGTGVPGDEFGIWLRHLHCSGSDPDSIYSFGIRIIGTE